MGSAKSNYMEMVHLLQSGSIAFPVFLLTRYHQIGLSEQEILLLMQIMVFQEKEHRLLPSVEEISQRMSLSNDQIAKMLRKLLEEGYIQIDENNDTGLLEESYSLTPLWLKIAEEFEVESQTNISQSSLTDQIFHQFEQEFGRPLSPYEYEMIAQWLDQDEHSPELIEAALQEAVFCSKVNFRYIDRILLEWKRNEIKTVDQAIEYARRFRKKGVLYQSNEGEAPKKFSFYNWVK
ncbi:DNA replication protein DnaD [Seinonella peptonophila]|uniref:DNA replication protein DnaD n=1 Tax=Seinonella peptonophila TaxID=112248 RepID=A0A1M4T107_9BACL|nr:DnaD domain protein [Seinonella peptonophila]SHE38161.1 DNA replication protein DnaD [Seinonella peptonophila]